MTSLDFTRDYVLENELLRLSPLRMGQAKPLAELANERNLWQYFLEKDSAYEKIKNYIQTAIDQRQSAQAYPFVVFDKREKNMLEAPGFTITILFWERSN